MAVFCYWHQRLHKVLLKWWQFLEAAITSKTAQNFAEVTAVFKDCLETLPKRPLKWWLFWKTPFSSTAQSSAGVMVVFKDWRKDWLIKILWKTLKYNFLCLGERNTPVDLTTLSSLRVCQTLKNCGKMQIFHVADRPFRHFVRVGRSKLCCQMQFLELAEQPFRHFVRVGRSKLWYDANISLCAATLSSLLACRTFKIVVKYKLWIWPSDHFITSRASDIQKCGKMNVFHRTDPDYARKLW